MTHDEALASALENAIPSFTANRENITRLLSTASDTLDLTEVLGEEFCTYIEWKEFDTWGIENLNGLVPLVQAGLTLNVDELYDDEGIPIESDDEGADDPFEFFMPTIQTQLDAHKLRLVEICTLEGNVVVAQENPSFICVHANDACVAEVNAALRQLGLILV